MRYEPLTPSQFSVLDGLEDWRVLDRHAHALFRAGSFVAAADLVKAIAAAADAADHHPNIDLRYPDRVHVAMTTHFTKSLSDQDVALARRISALASAARAVAEPLASQGYEVAIDSMEIGQIQPFWAAVLGYRIDGVAVVDPNGIGPSMWFQQMEKPRTERSRFHIDVIVPHDLAEARVAAALAAGGRLVTDRFARAWWVLADADGNEACVCTWQDRD
ncbi:MAG: VOC family protein [Acidimicrobiia bacterium]